MNVTKWEYRWRETYWAEVERKESYGVDIVYNHFWKYDVSQGGAEPELFPSDTGLNYFGRDGWELAAMVPRPVSHVTYESPQRGPSYTAFTAYTIIFKRPIA